MTELWGWKYKGHDFVGYKGLGNSCFVGVNELAEIYTIRIGEVANLRPAKVVDEADIVFDDAAIEEILYFLNLAWVGVLPSCNLDNKRLGKLLNLFREPPKVTEPKGFGAIVEAGSKFYRDETLEWQLTITKSRDKWMNKYQGFACWSDLTNPVVISEGVTK